VLLEKKPKKSNYSGGYIDWFLPSKDELNQLYVNKVAIGEAGVFQPLSYWSSSETGQEAAWEQDFNSGEQTGNSDKSNSIYVRAVRAF